MTHVSLDLTPDFSKRTLAGTAKLTIKRTPGVTSLSLVVPITDDPDFEGDETFTLTLCAPINAALGAPNPALATILADVVDPEGAVALGYLDAVADRCTELTVPDWIDRLGGVDVWTRDHCVTMIDALRVE